MFNKSKPSLTEHLSVTEKLSKLFYNQSLNIWLMSPRIIWVSGSGCRIQPFFFLFRREFHGPQTNWENVCVDTLMKP